LHTSGRAVECPARPEHGPPPGPGMGRPCMKQPKNKVLVANGQGFWGDSILGPVRLVKEGPLDYLTLDYLAEVTLSIMQKLRSRDPKKGYATDFVKLIDRTLPDIVEKDIRVVANAGGVNPHACKDALLEVIARHGASGVKIAIVEGDDILDQLDDLMAHGETLANMDTGEPLSSVRDEVASVTTKTSVPWSIRLTAVCMTQICASMPAITAWPRPVALKAAAKSRSSMQEKCIFGRIVARAAVAAAASSGTVAPRPLGYCSVSRIGTASSVAAAIRVRALRMVRAGACMAGTRRSCMSMTIRQEVSA